MKKYIGVKLVEAEQMTLGEYNNFKGWTIPADEDANKEGYKVIYSDDYISWSPKEIFEKSYLELADPEGTRILPADVNDFIMFSNTSKIGEKTAALHVTLRNEFEILESSSCVDPNNFDLDVGRAICFKKIEDKVWGYLGFLLQCARSGMK